MEPPLDPSEGVEKGVRPLVLGSDMIPGKGRYLGKDEGV
jgi:hypothetical protein